MRKFDLNIDKILEDWNVEHAIREIIANAIDEQTITNTRDIVIEKKSEGIWSIKDFGRGIRYEHFVQNESLEKQRTKGIIGKFGIGLKDALATFDRKGVSVEIFSQYGDIKVRRISKGGFDDIVTLLDINNSVPKDMYEQSIKGKFDYKHTDTFMGFHCGKLRRNY